MEPGTDEPFYSSDNNLLSRLEEERPDLDVWKMEYDWEGNETGRTYLGQLKDIEDPGYEYREVKGEAELLAEMTDYGVLVTDPDGREVGRILIDFNAETQGEWSAAVYGRMILVQVTSGSGKSMTARSFLFLAPQT